MRLLITGAYRWTDDQLDDLRAAGHQVVLMPDESGSLPEGADEVEVVFGNGIFLHHPHTAFPNLKWVQLTSAGLDRVPVKELEARGVSVFNARGVYAIPMAEWVVMSILQLSKQSRFFEQNQASRTWEKRRGLTELSGKSACIIGLGDIGAEVAIRLRAFGVRVVGVRASGKPSPHADEVVTPESLLDVLPNADIVVLTVPLTAETEHLIDASLIAAMKEDATLVNVSRGAVIDESALVDALEAGKFSGVALDVFTTEPLPADNPLWGMNRVIVSPHNSFESDANHGRLWTLFTTNLKRMVGD